MKAPFRTLAAGVAVAFGLLTATASRADFAFGVTFLGNQLITIDTTTGAGTLVGPLSTPISPFGLSDVGGKLYTFDSNADVIRQLNPSTGGTLASFNIGVGPVLGQGGLAFQNSTVGFLTSALDPTTLAPVNNLFRFDISTGMSTLVAHTADTLEALAFAPGGTLYGLGKNDGNLFTIDTTTGAMMLVGNVGVTVGSPTGGLAFGPDGSLFATLDDVLYKLNLTTGAATLVNPDTTGNVVTDAGFSSISGLAFGPAAVPEPSSIVLCGVFAAVAGGYRMVRRPRVA